MEARVSGRLTCDALTIQGAEGRFALRVPSSAAKPRECQSSSDWAQAFLVPARTAYFSSPCSPAVAGASPPAAIRFSSSSARASDDAPEAAAAGCGGTPVVFEPPAAPPPATTPPLFPPGALPNPDMSSAAAPATATSLTDGGCSCCAKRPALAFFLTRACELEAPVPSHVLAERASRSDEYTDGTWPLERLRSFAACGGDAEE